MPTPLQTADEIIASFGLGKETNFGVAVVPTIFHATDQWTPSVKRASIPRTGVTKTLGQRYPGQGGLSISASLDVESSPDVVGQLLAGALGSQSAPTHNIVNTTLSAAITVTGSQAVTPVSMDGIFVGAVLTIDTAGNLETVTVTAVTPTTFTANFTKTHLINAPIVLTSTTAYLSKLTMGTRLPTFTGEHVRYNVGAIGNTFGRDYTGLKVDTLGLTLDPKGGLKTKFSFVGCSVFQQASPATPSFSSKQVFSFQNPSSMMAYKGASTAGSFVELGGVGQVSVLGWDCSGANNLVKDFFSFGQGPTVADIPEGPRKYSGKISLGFESAAQYTDFLGAATGPTAAIPGVAMTMIFVSTDMADATLGIPYAIVVKLPNCFLSEHSDPQKNSGASEQSFTWEAAQSAPGAGDDVSILLLNTNSTIY